MSVCVRAGTCAGGVRFSNSNRITHSDYRILLLLEMHIPSIHALLMTENSVRTLRPSDALQNGAKLTQREEMNCSINVVIVILFAYKMYSHRFIKF